MISINGNTELQSQVKMTIIHWNLPFFSGGQFTRLKGNWKALTHQIYNPFATLLGTPIIFDLFLSWRMNNCFVASQSSENIVHWTDIKVLWSWRWCWGKQHKCIVVVVVLLRWKLWFCNYVEHILFMWAVHFSLMIWDENLVFHVMYTPSECVHECVEACACAFVDKTFGIWF